MISITKQYTHQFKKLGNADCLKHRDNNVIMLGEKPQKVFYRGEYRKHYIKYQEVPEAAATDNKNKCSYCESFAHHPTIEHYRPHGAGKSYLSPCTGINYSGHTGYNWLCYEWSNLYASCTGCNEKKNSFFPILGIRASMLNPLTSTLNLDPTIPPLITEFPLLINPALVNPRTHFNFNTNGEMIGMTDSGKVSIELYNLNRPDLLVNRQIKVINPLIEDIQTQIEFYNNYNNLKKIFGNILKGKIYTLSSFVDQIEATIEKLKNRICNHEEYIGFAEYILNNFKSLVINQLKNATANINTAIEQAFKKVFPAISL